MSLEVGAEALGDLVDRLDSAEVAVEMLIGPAVQEPLWLLPRFSHRSWDKIFDFLRVLLHNYCKTTCYFI